MDRSCADNMGMLATCMNALAMRDALESIGVKAEIQSAFAINGILQPFDQRKAVELLEAGTVVLFAAGTGHPYFTTDTCIQGHKTLTTVLQQPPCYLIK